MTCFARNLRLLIRSLALAEVDVFKVSNVIRLCGEPQGSVEEYASIVIDSFSDHGFQGYEWPTYVDIEILFVVEKLLERGSLSPDEANCIDGHLDEMPKASYNLLGKLGLLDSFWEVALPLEWRLGLIRALLVRHMEKPLGMAQLPPIVYVDLQPLDEREVLFKNIHEELKSLRPLSQRLRMLSCRRILYDRYWSVLDSLRA